jgi:DNA polymerase III epsilon subunit-like protein
MKANQIKDNSKQKILVFDTETQWLGHYFNLPWSICWSIYEGDRLIQTEDRYIWWDNFKISDDAARLSHFNLNNYKQKAEQPDRVLLDFEKALYNEDCVVVGHNVLNFDAMIHNSWRRNVGSKPDFSWLTRLYDTNCLQKAYKLHIDIDFKNFLAFQYKLANFKQKGLKTRLGVCCEEYGIDYDEGLAHAAEYDVSRNKLVFDNQVANLGL